MTLLHKAPLLEDFPHILVETLRFADTGRNGHITSSVFAICCQSGRLALLSDPARGIVPARSQFVLASLQLDYLSELHWPGTVKVGTRVGRVGRASVTLGQALFQTGRCAATARSVAVLMDATIRRSVPIPPMSVDVLQTFVGSVNDGPGEPGPGPSPTLLPVDPDRRAPLLR